MSSSTYQKVTHIFECETVTPIFNYGANQSGESFPRTASLKGMIRYWWRAILPYLMIDNEPVISKIKTGTGEFRLNVLKREIELFGGVLPSSLRKLSSNTKMDALKSPIKLKIEVSTKNNPIQKVLIFKKNKKVNKNKIKQSEWIKKLNPIKMNAFCSNNFKIILQGKVSSDESIRKPYVLTKNDWKEIVFSTRIALTFGGLGRRIRKGRGSIHIKNENEFENNKLVRKNQYFNLSNILEDENNSIKINLQSSQTNDSYEFPHIFQVSLGKKINLDGKESLGKFLNHLDHFPKDKDPFYKTILGNKQNRNPSYLWVKIQKMPNSKGNNSYAPLFILFQPKLMEKKNNRSIIPQFYQLLGDLSDFQNNSINSLKIIRGGRITDLIC